MAYNPYNEIKAVYNAKVNYGKATTGEERKKQNDIATAAREKLKSYGYGDIANQVSADGADAATVKKIMDNWAAKVDTVTGNYKTGVDNPAYNAEIKLASDNNQKLFDQQASDKSMMTDKYGKLENYIYDYNPYESDIGKSIMEGYTWKGAKASDNEIASGAASNSGNIDSFAAANASRQQLAFTNAGKQAVLNDFNTRIGNAQNILSNLGIYLQNQDAGMQKSINMQDNRAQNIFNNEQTALNNDVARKSEIASVTGYVPDEWAIQNDAFLKNFVDENGKLKAEYNDMDFQEHINDAKAQGNTELANKYAILRGLKIMGNFSEYGKYLNQGDVSYVQPQRTAEYDLTQQQIASAEKIAQGENETNLALADKEAAVTQQQINASLEATRLENEKDAYAGYNVLLSMWPTNEVEKRAFIEEFIKPLYESGTAVPPESLKQLIVANSAAYNIDVDDATKICQAYGVSTDWLSGYRDRTKDDGMVTWYDGSTHEGQYGGMVKK